ncbi:MAG: hypothetical protein ACREBN_04575 [Burkholderiaceae bacterium]
MSEAPAQLRTAAVAGYASLLTSTGTLVCCAIPALLVAVGAGAVLASAVSAFPALVWLSEYKALVFGAAGLMLAAAGALQWRARSLPCPADPAQAATCIRTRRVSGAVYLFSVVVFLVGAFFAFGLPLLLAADAGG